MKSHRYPDIRISLFAFRFSRNVKRPGFPMGYSQNVWKHHDRYSTIVTFTRHLFGGRQSNISMGCSDSIEIQQMVIQ